MVGTGSRIGVSVMPSSSLGKHVLVSDVLRYSRSVPFNTTGSFPPVLARAEGTFGLLFFQETKWGGLRKYLHLGICSRGILSFWEKKYPQNTPENNFRVYKATCSFSTHNQMLPFLKVNTIKGIQERIGEVTRFLHEKSKTTPPAPRPKPVGCSSRDLGVCDCCVGHRGLQRPGGMWSRGIHRLPVKGAKSCNQLTHYICSCCSLMSEDKANSTLSTWSGWDIYL